MSVRLEDIKPGDEVTAEFTVAFVDHRGVAVSSFESGRLRGSEIISHTPAPVVFEKGDVVKVGDGANWVIVAIDDGMAWLRFIELYATVPTLKLTLVRKASPP